MRAILIIALLLIAGCEQIAPLEQGCGDGICRPDEIDYCFSDCPFRPEPRQEPPDYSLYNRTVTVYEDDYEPPQTIVPSSTVTPSDPIDTESIEDYLPTKGFLVAGRYNLLAINETIDKVIGTLTAAQMRQVLATGRLRKNTQAFGPRSAISEQFLTLRSGKVVFGEVDGEPTTYLLYNEQDPIYEYVLRLQGGMFKFFEGEAISMLGHDYIIEEVTNTSIRLTGITTDDEIVLRDGKSTLVNANSYSDANVTVRNDYIKYVLLAPDELKLTPGMSLAKEVGTRALLTNRLDIEYSGLDQVPTVPIVFDESSSRYKLTFTNNANLTYTVPLATRSPIKPGDDDNMLIYSEDQTVREDDYFIISTRRERGVSNLIRLLSIDESDKLIRLEDTALEKFLLSYTGTPGVDAKASLIAYGVSHKIVVEKNQSLRIDLDGDGSIGTSKVPIFISGDARLYIEAHSDDQMRMHFEIPAEVREDSSRDLTHKVTLTRRSIQVEGVEFAERDDDLYGVNNFGTIFILRSELGESEGEDLTIFQPVTQRFANVLVKAYE